MIPNGFYLLAKAIETGANMKIVANARQNGTITWEVPDAIAARCQEAGIDMRDFATNLVVLIQALTSFVDLGANNHLAAAAALGVSTRQEAAALVEQYR
jgi:hypothetical protein